MRILQANKFYYPEVGGIENVVKTTAEGLSDRGYSMPVLASKPRGFSERISISGVPIQKTFSLGVLQSVPVSPNYPIKLREMAANADLIHYHLPNPLSVCSHFVASQTSPSVVTYHSDIVRQSKSLKVYAPILHSFLDCVDHIMVTSPQLRDNSPFLEPHHAKCTVVPLSLNMNDIPTPIRPLDFPVQEGEPFVLFAGRLNYYKGVEYLLQAATKFDIPVVIAGNGDRKSALEGCARKLGISDRVHFLGYVSDETLHYCYEYAEVFILPSIARSEAFGIVQLEAMAHGTPVVNTNLATGVPWVSPHGRTGLTVPPRDSSALADAIRELLHDSQLRNQYGQAARNRVASIFTQKQMLDRVERVYEDVAFS